MPGKTRKASKLFSRGFCGFERVKGFSIKGQGYSNEHAINKKNKNGLKSFIAFYLASYKTFDLFRKYKSEYKCAARVAPSKSKRVVSGRKREASFLS
jgi:hypothetical protein